MACSCPWKINTRVRKAVVYYSGLPYYGMLLPMEDQHTSKESSSMLLWFALLWACSCPWKINTRVRKAVVYYSGLPYYGMLLPMEDQHTSKESSSMLLWFALLWACSCPWKINTRVRKAVVCYSGLPYYGMLLPMEDQHTSKESSSMLLWFALLWACSCPWKINTRVRKAVVCYSGLPYYGMQHFI